MPSSQNSTTGAGSPRALFTAMTAEVSPPIVSSPWNVTVKSFSFAKDDRRRHTLIPARDFRLVSTKLQMDVPAELLPLLHTTDALRELKLEAVSFFFGIDKELLIQVQSFRHDSANIPHGTPLATLTFVSKVAVQVDLKTPSV